MVKIHLLISNSSINSLVFCINSLLSVSPDFIFAFPAFNVRSTEINAVLGRSPLKRLDACNDRRRENFELFLKLIDPGKYRTDFDLEGSCNYAFNLVLNRPDVALRERLETKMRESGVEFRRGSAGGGNQLRQPYLKGIVPDGEYARYPEVEHIHFFGYYIGNYPTLSTERIRELCAVLNSVKG